MRSTLPTFVALLAAAGAATAAPIRVVTTLPSYAAIAQAVGGARVSAASISRSEEDPHFVKPKPSLAFMLRAADLFVTTGLDLELWAPVLVDKSGNPRIRDGQPGFVSASQGVPLLEVPTSLSREAGDIHIYGNPHIYTGPLNAKAIAANIAAGLKRVDPAGAAQYDAQLVAFERRLDEALYGPRLAGLLGGATLDPLLRQGKLFEFLAVQSYQGRPLADALGGWLARLRPWRGAKIVTYHRSWSYFVDTFGFAVVDYVEPKPGIPPSARHVHELIQKIAAEGVRVLVTESYFDPQEPRAIAERTGSRAVLLPLGPQGEPPGDYIALVDSWVEDLARALAG